MSKKYKNEKAVSPVVGFFLMILIIVFMALIISGVVIFGAGNLAAVPYHVVVTSSENDHIDVFVSNITM